MIHTNSVTLFIQFCSAALTHNNYNCLTATHVLYIYIGFFMRADILTLSVSIVLIYYSFGIDG